MCYRVCGILQSHTCTVVRECCKGDEASQCKKQKKIWSGGVLATRYSQGPWTDFDAKNAKTRVVILDPPTKGHVKQ